MNEVMPYIHSIEKYLMSSGWMLSVFLVVLSTALVSYFIGFLLKRLHKRLQHTATVWDDTLVRSIITPIKVFIWLGGISLATYIVATTTKNEVIHDIIPKAWHVGLIVVVSWFLLRFISYGSEDYINKVKHKKPVDRTMVHALRQILRLSVIITGILISMSSLGIPINSLLAVGGIGGLAVSFAARDMLANFFGGLMIYLDSPFKVGDWVRSPDRNIEGFVEYIGWRLTRIRTFDKRPLYVPNGIFSTISVENPSRMLNRRIKTIVGVRYDDATKIRSIVSDVEKMLREHPDIDTNQTLMVRLMNFGASALEFMVYTFTKTTKWTKFQEVQEDVFLKIIDIIARHGAQCAFPTTTLHIPEGVMLEQKETGVEYVT